MPAEIDTGQRLAAWAQQLQAQNQGGSGFSPLLFALGSILGRIGGVFARDVQITALKAPPGICASDKPMNQVPQGRPATWQKACKAVNLSAAEIAKTFKEIGEAGAVRSASIESITGTSHGLGGGFSAATASSNPIVDGGGINV